MSKAAPPDALLLLTSSCPHCPAVLQALGELVKQGVIGRLEAVNIEHRPEVAADFGVRSVPWIRIGEFQFEGLHSLAELRQWAERAGTTTGLGEYFHELLKSGKLDQVSRHAARGGPALAALLQLLGDPDTELTARIGVNAVIEGLEHEPVLAEAIAPLSDMARHADAHIRGDAAHLLSFTHQPAARPLLKALLADDNADVRDIAREGLERLDQVP